MDENIELKHTSNDNSRGENNVEYEEIEVNHDKKITVCSNVAYAAISM